MREMAVGFYQIVWLKKDSFKPVNSTFQMFFWILIYMVRNISVVKLLPVSILGCLACLVFGSSVAGATITPDTKLRYTQTGNTARIDGCNGLCEARVVIPAQISIGKTKKLKVTSIARDAFNITALSPGYTAITSVVIPSSVVSIGDSAFSSNNLTSVDLPAGLTSIGDLAFANNALTQVNIPKKVTHLGDYAFLNNQISQLSLPSTITSINWGAFQNNQLTSLTIPNKVTHIWNLAFSYNHLTSVSFPSGLTHIENFAFSENQLTNVTIPKKVNHLGSGVFQNNHNLASVTFLGNAPQVGSGIFEGTKTGAKLIRSKKLLGFGTNGSLWNGLLVSEK